MKKKQLAATAGHRQSVKRHRTAGGVVINASRQILVLVRDVLRDGQVIHEVRLPKGHLDTGESDEQAAVREVGEESGYSAVRIVGDLGEFQSAYDYKGKRHLRDERYFLMCLLDQSRGVAQPMGEEEALFQPRWLSPEAAIEALTYESEREFARRAAAMLQRKQGEFPVADRSGA